MSKQTKIFSPIIITLPHIIKNEARALHELSKAGAEIIHIRKPENSPEQIENLLKELSELCPMDCFTLHGMGGENSENGRMSQVSLAVKYGCGGIHFKIGDTDKIRERMEFETCSTSGTETVAKLRKSISTHSLNEVTTLCLTDLAIDYVFLSPIFDSISKSGYSAGFNLAHLKHEITQNQELQKHHPIIAALGGVDKSNIRSLHEIGFSASALLGAVWVESNNEIDIDATVLNFQAAKRAWIMGFSELQLISDGDMQVAREFLEGGGRWIQLRMKNTPIETIIARGKELLHLCSQYNAVLLVNDNPMLVPQIRAHGVHLGRSDMDPDQARKLLGNNAIIGVTANTVEHILQSSACDIDYIGLGPFRYTTTKDNLSPILGAAGYSNILSQMEERSIAIPIIAIGGITPQDIAELGAAGLRNFAVSGAISKASNVKSQTEKFIQEIHYKH